MKIIFASNNANKLAEIQAALGNEFQLVSLSDIGFSGDIPETGRTLEANALQKARYIFERFNTPVFADDSGLEIEALDGEPGVDTAHYSGSRDAAANIAKVLSGLSNQKNRQAKFRTVIAFIDDDSEELFQGEVRGTISMKMKGEKGFGYDPIFVPENDSRTFAEMEKSEKAAQSHRVRALEKFVEYLKAGH
ncbi:RdgB/HAM1 family non-canonical purine NTP pyrophosphatase [Cryomorpha ignava]|uniref:dITP/XTP pyrophosphatase n=1 Tax=Cryomorpha ignava TaxID=101383 RepID=A0A7K3WQS0_9FLAO|nr:RdgB/HAM1 family non-canonical purine NTP pyrophosphatase [Cryomorpha ignava]NEN24013.1 RdgB/HAM1 family non-canonical purine NTP pyrophosphatase [Cryomorpha ignava]